MTDGVFEFLNGGIQDILALSNALLAITHPDQYRMALEDAFKIRMRAEELKQPKEARRALDAFPSLWHAVALIANRKATTHSDHGTRCEWFDHLITIGASEDDRTVLEFPTVGYRFAYLSGTSALFSGKLFIHGVSHSLEERVALAFYMRDNIQEWLGSRPAYHVAWSQEV